MARTVTTTEAPRSPPEPSRSPTSPSYTASPAAARSPEPTRENYLTASSVSGGAGALSRDRVRRAPLPHARRQARDFHGHGRERQRGRAPDRIRGRGSAHPPDLRGRAAEARHPVADGRGLPTRLTHAHRHDDEAIDPAALAGELEEGQPDDVVLRTVGIDIGSTTSHAMFARLRLQRLADSLSSRYVVVEREVLHRSPIVLTPYSAGNTIDAAALEAHIAGWYATAGLAREDVDTGAVIFTGAALERDNEIGRAHV